MRNDPLKAAHYPSLDGLRAVAALMVVYGHAGYSGWVPLVVGCATLGVVLFFFLSGFLMGSHYMPSAPTGLLDRERTRYWLAFLLRRFLRVYPPYVFAPIVGYLLLMPRMPPDFRDALPIENLPILHELSKVALFKGTLGIYWTVKIELGFYLIYPAIIAMCLLFRKTTLALLGVFAVLILLRHVPRDFGGMSWRWLSASWAGYIAVFVAGVFTAATAKAIPASFGRRAQWNALASGSLGAFVLAVFLISRSEPTQSGIWKHAWMFSPLLFVLFVALVRSDGLVSRTLSSRVFVAIGRASYSLYLVHIIGFHVVLDLLPPQYSGLPAAIAVLLVLVPAYYLLFERPFVQLSRRIAVTETPAIDAAPRASPQRLPPPGSCAVRDGEAAPASARAD